MLKKQGLFGFPGELARSEWTNSKSLGSRMKNFASARTTHTRRLQASSVVSVITGSINCYKQIYREYWSTELMQTDVLSTSYAPSQRTSGQSKPSGELPMFWKYKQLCSFAFPNPGFIHRNIEPKNFHRWDPRRSEADTKMCSVCVF